MRRTVRREPTSERRGPRVGQDLLIRRATGGDAAAYEELVRAHYRRVHATAFHLLGNHEDAEDLTQECFLRAHRSLDWFRREGSFAGWLRRILVHLVRDRFRREGRRPFAPLPHPISETPAIGGPGQEARGRELSLLVTEAIERLPDHLRVALLLRTRDGLAYAEIAEAAGVTAATARTQVMKARRTLLRTLGPHLAHGAHGDRSEP